jgi:hypothetical protein
MDSNLLDELAVRYQTNKGSQRIRWSFQGKAGVAPAHHYTGPYHTLFGPIRMRVRSLLEFGVFNGGSMRMWEEYFPNAVIYGVDTKVRGSSVGRITTFKRDCQSRHPHIASRGPFDIIIDDADHTTKAQIVTWFQWQDLVAPGGYYCIEDISLKTWYDTSYPTMTDWAYHWADTPPPGWTCQVFPSLDREGSTGLLCVMQRDGDP